MDVVTYRAFTGLLLSRLEARPEVLGLVALGSMAERGEVPDEFSDHDFFVIAERAAAEALRQTDDWLPSRDRIRLRYRETAHGVKVVYEDAHLLEFAVFTLDEIALARVNRYRVLLDRSDVESRMARARAETQASLERERASDEWLCGQILTEILMGASRAARGEVLSGSERLTSATRHLVTLLRRHSPAPAEARPDDLDVLRRIELAYPELGVQLSEASSAPSLTRASVLLDAAENTLGPVLPAFPHAATKAIRARIAALRHVGA